MSTSFSRIAEILYLSIEEGATDVHLCAGGPPMVRKHGLIVPLSGDALTAEMCQELVFSLLAGSTKN